MPRFAFLSVRYWQLVLVSAFGSFCSLSAADSPASLAASKDSMVLFRSATVIDGSGGPARPNTDVLILGERIQRVAASGKIDADQAKGATIVDLHGRFLIPGLIDSHVHLATPPNRRQAEAVLRRDIYGGVTTVRDMADDLRAVAELARETLVGELAGPDIYYAALMAGPDFFTDKRTIQVSQGATAGKVPWMQAITDQSDLPLAVAQAKGTYATAIKLYADLSPSLAQRITAEAHRQHMLVWGHATLYPAKPSDVVSAGVDAISHACLLVREPQAHVPRWAEPHGTVDLDPFRAGNDPSLDRLFKEMVRRGTILDATVWAYGTDTADSSSSPPLPPGSCDDTIGGAITRQAFLSGVAIATGTDNLADWRDPWPDLFHELHDLSTKAAMPVAAILHSATMVGARSLGQEHDMGSIEEGKLANMVVLARDPMLSLENLKSVVMTVKRGHIFRRRDFVPLKKQDITDR